MGHQVTIEELASFKREIELVVSTKDKKKLIVRVTATVVDFVVQKDKLNHVFTNLTAAVKRYNNV